MSLKDLKIKTSVVKRIGKELVFYESETIKQEARIQALVDSGADDHDIRKQQEVLKETTDMFPDVKKRLEKSVLELQNLVSVMSKSEVFSNSEEFLAASQVLQDF
jgi:tubulin-specific chaperone A